MKFADLFVPKWQNSNPSVRKRAIEKIKDAKLLSQIQEKDVDQMVREAAARRLDDLKDMRGQ